MKKRHLILVAGAAALLASAGGVAYATIPDGQGVIHACYDNQSGQARIVDTAPNSLPKGCGAKEAALAWNQTGPPGQQGPTGATGPQGEQGPPGPAGPADAWFATGSNNDADGQVHTVVSTDLPDGTYIVVGSVTLHLGEDDGSATCYLRLNGIVLDQGTFDFSSGEVEHGAMTLMTDADGPLTADIACSLAHDDPDAFISNGIKARLLATRVALH